MQFLLGIAEAVSKNILLNINLYFQSKFGLIQQDSELIYMCVKGLNKKNYNKNYSKK